MSDPQNDYSRQQTLIAALRDPRCYPHAADEVQVIETHISWVVLAGQYAYKIKKAVDLGFLDYTGLEARRFCCNEEIRLNRRTAPDIYLDVVAIGGSSERPQLNAQLAFEYAVRMHRFPSDDLMDKLLMQGKIMPQHIDSLAATIARFHERLPAADMDSGFGSASSAHAAALQNFVSLRSHLTDDRDSALVTMLEDATKAEYSNCCEIFEARRAGGAVRECHGDLHLGNIALIAGEPVPFDCIEFNPELRWIDVMSEVAFTVMDLLHREHAEFAWRFLNAYLEANGDYDGIAVLRFYLAYRAAVRAKVCAIRVTQAGLTEQIKSDELMACRSYLALARQYLEQRRSALIITHGLPGSGKTTFTQLALQQMGAIRIRSDVERKRLFGLDALESSHSQDGGIYSTEATQRTYARLHELAQGMLAAGYTVIVDAAFLRQEEREMFRQLAQNMAVPFAIASLHAKDAVLRERLRERRNDASEADVAVLKLLQSKQQPLTPNELEYSARFTTAEAPGSAGNSLGWHKLDQLFGAQRMLSANV